MNLGRAWAGVDRGCDQCGSRDPTLGWISDMMLQKLKDCRGLEAAAKKSAVVSAW
jgi:hypothetical protein